MRTWVKRLLAMSICSALSACTIGNGMICGPQTPKAYCDRAAYEKLAHPKPFIELWEKTGTSAEQRSLDWVACGGANNGDFSPTIGRLKDEKFPGEVDYNAAHSRLQQTLKQCMVTKGYRYVGQSRISTE